MLLIKNMVEKKLFAKTLPVLLGFFVMGFCDIVGSIAAYCYFPKKPSIRVQTVLICQMTDCLLYSKVYSSNSRYKR